MLLLTYLADNSASGRRVGFLSKTEADKLREYNEVGKLMLPGGFPASKNLASLHQPQVHKVINTFFHTLFHKCTSVSNSIKLDLMQFKLFRVHSHVKFLPRVEFITENVLFSVDIL